MHIINRRVLLRWVSLLRPAPIELPQDRKVARVNSCSGAIKVAYPFFIPYILMFKKPYIVGIAGGSASGKTSFISELKQTFNTKEITVVSQDNYYFPKEKQLIDENGKINFDLPGSIDRASFHKDILALIDNKSIKITEYTFNVSPENAKSINIKPASILILEGLFVFHYKEIRDLIDLRIYIDVRDSIKLERRIKRDIKERGYPEDDVKYQWENHVMPSYKKYLRPYRDDAHVIITNNHHYTKGLEVLVDHLRGKINRQ